MVESIDHYRSFDHAFSYLTGVSDFNPWQLRYMLRPCNHNEDFDKYFNETLDLFKKYLHTNSKIYAIPGAGRITMEIALNSFLEPGDKLLLIDNSYWGRYPKTIAEHYDIEIIHLALPPEEPIDPQKVEDKIKEVNGPIRAAHMIHVCTETGVLNPVKHVGDVLKEKSPNTIFMVDGATAFAGNPVRQGDWNIDVYYYVSHKGFNGPSGLVYMSLSDKAEDFIKNRKTREHSWYSSIKTWKETFHENKEDSRHCKESFPNIILHANRAKLDLIEQMGEENYLKKYELSSKAVRMGMRKMTDPENMLITAGPKCKNCPGCDAPDVNLTTYGKGRFCSQTVIGMAYPKGVNHQKIHNTLGDRYWLYAPHYGFGDERGKEEPGGYFYSNNGIRIGMVNDCQHYPRNILAIVTAMEYSLIEGNIKGIRKGAAIEATNEVLKEIQSDLKWHYTGY